MERDRVTASRVAVRHTDSVFDPTDVLEQGSPCGLRAHWGSGPQVARPELARSSTFKRADAAKRHTPTPEFGGVAISAERESNSYIGRRHGLEAKPEAQSLSTTSAS
jgi:hypothetical protein